MPGYPQSTTLTLVLGLSFEEGQSLCMVLMMFGYEAIVKLEGEFRAPLQRRPRRLVTTVTTDCPVERLLQLLEFVRG